MYIRMSQFCDKVVILKSVSQAVRAFDSDGNPLKGVRKSTTEQIATFRHSQPISHPEIPDNKAAEFEIWRATQLYRINQAFIESAARGRLGGMPIVKTKAHLGNPDFRVGEFSGSISPVVEVELHEIKSVMSERLMAPGKKHQPVEGALNLADRVSKDYIINKLHGMTEDFMRFIQHSGKKGTDLFSVDDVLDMRAAFAAFGCVLDTRGIGYKTQGNGFGRNAAEEGAKLFKSIQESLGK